jgi:SAM-dependent methyltransferase
MIAAATAKAPELSWVTAGLQDLARHLEAGRFDLVVLAGNVVPYVAAADRPAAVAACAGRLRPGGLLVAGFSTQPGWPTPAEYDHWCADAGLDLADRWATWSRDPFDDGDYAVSVHRRPAV